MTRKQAVWVVAVRTKNQSVVHDLLELALNSNDTIDAKAEQEPAVPAAARPPARH